MSLRTIQRLTMMSVLVLGSVAATGCGDDDNDDDDGEEDAGGGNNNGGDDAGGNNNGGEDAGLDAGGGALMCGDEKDECTGGSAAGIKLVECCTESDACGINLEMVPGIKDTFPGCQPQNAPESGGTHAFCDQVIAMANGTTGIAAADGINIKVKGCCTAENFCGVNANDIDLVDAAGDPSVNLSLKLGCISLGKFVPPGTLPIDPNTIPCELGDGG